MDSIIKIFLKTRLALTVIAMMTVIGMAVNVADAPPSEAVTPADILCYQIDDGGRISDGNGRVRGWMKGDEIYGPDLELKYRLSGRRLEDIR